MGSLHSMLFRKSTRMAACSFFTLYSLFNVFASVLVNSFRFGSSILYRVNEKPRTYETSTNGSESDQKSQVQTKDVVENHQDSMVSLPVLKHGIEQYKEEEGESPKLFFSFRYQTYRGGCFEQSSLLSFNPTNCEVKEFSVSQDDGNIPQRNGEEESMFLDVGFDKKGDVVMNGDSEENGEILIEESHLLPDERNVLPEKVVDGESVLLEGNILGPDIIENPAVSEQLGVDGENMDERCHVLPEEFNTSPERQNEEEFVLVEGFILRSDVKENMDVNETLDDLNEQSPIRRGGCELSPERQNEEYLDVKDKSENMQDERYSAEAQLEGNCAPMRRREFSGTMNSDGEKSTEPSSTVVSAEVAGEIAMGRKLQPSINSDSDDGDNFFATDSNEFISDKDFGLDYTDEGKDYATMEALDSSDSDDESSDILWEQQDFMEQLKMDMKKARGTGLPTIGEEDEFPKVNDVFTQWKINDKFRHEDRITELHKFYRIYRERMRKLDILNFQKRIAIGCLQSKNMMQTVTRDKDTRTALASMISGTFSIRKRRISASDSVKSAIRELQSEFELVYVAHMCLSWEILHWQYLKALEIWESDQLRLRQYNEVAGEYQQFQVLLERFIENEPFEGPRVENYTDKRCASHKLLQVPVIREDRSKDKKMREGAITSDQLIEIMEEAIRTFWKFVKSDASTQELNRVPASEDPAVVELQAEIRSSLAKKEKKLKELLKNGNKWIMRRFQRQQQEDMDDHVNYFFLEVDMKLVTRVLNMSKVTTEQLLWCRSKLDNINFVGRKMHVQPSFCLFP